MIISQNVKKYPETNIAEERERAKAIHFSKNYFMLETFTGKQLEFPYSVSPRLLLATPKERAAGELMPGGYGIEWEVLNEHLSVEGLIQGKVSTESWRSVYEWYELRLSVEDTPFAQHGPVIVSPQNKMSVP